MDQSSLPGTSYLLLTIKDVRTHTKYMYHGDQAKLDIAVRIDEVLKYGKRDEEQLSKENTGFQEKGKVVFVVSNPETLLVGDIKELVGKQVVWGIDWWKIPGKGHYHLTNLHEPFPDNKFSAQDLVELRVKVAD